MFIMYYFVHVNAYAYKLMNSFGNWLINCVHCSQDITAYIYKDK